MESIALRLPGAQCCGLTLTSLPFPAHCLHVVKSLLEYLQDWRLEPRTCLHSRKVMLCCGKEHRYMNSDMASLPAQVLDNIQPFILLPNRLILCPICSQGMIPVAMLLQGTTAPIMMRVGGWCCSAPQPHQFNQLTGDRERLGWLFLDMPLQWFVNSG